MNDVMTDNTFRRDLQYTIFYQWSRGVFCQIPSKPLFSRLLFLPAKNSVTFLENHGILWV